MGYIPNHDGQMVVSSNFASWNWSTVHLFYQFVATSSMVRIIRPDQLSGYSPSNVVAIDGLDWHTYFPCTGLHESISSSLMLKLVFGFSRISKKAFASTVFFRMLDRKLSIAHPLEGKAAYTDWAWSQHVCRFPFLFLVFIVRYVYALACVPIPQVNRGVNSPADISMDISKLVRLLGVTPISFKDGVKLTLENDATSWQKESLHVRWLQFSFIKVKEIHVYKWSHELLLQGPIWIHGIMEWQMRVHWNSLYPWNDPESMNLNNSTFW